MQELAVTRPKQPEVDLGLRGEQVPLHSHLAYFWESDKEFADAVAFLAAGLRGKDHCVIFGHQEANETVCKILSAGGFDVHALLTSGRLTVLSGQRAADKILELIAADFERAIARGAPLVRLLGNIGWGKADWPDDEDLLVFESKITAAAANFPSVILCMYDAARAPASIIRHGALETHPLAFGHRGLRESAHYIPTDQFLKQFETVAAQISARRQAEQALKTSEDRFKTLFKTAPIGIATVDVSGKLVEANRSFIEMFEYAPEEPPGMSFPEITSIDGAEKIETLFAELVRGDRKDFRIEKCYRTKGGKYVWGRTTCSAIRDTRGILQYAVVMIDNITERKRAEETVRSIVEGTAAVTGANFFASLVRSVASALRVKYAFLAECHAQRTQASSLAFWKGDGFGDNFEYDIRQTPCEKVVEGNICYYARDLQQAFPLSAAIVQLEAVSYLGIPVVGASGEVIGHFVVMDDKPMGESPYGLSILKTFAARAGAELDRQRAEGELRTALAEVESLKNRLNAENIYLQEEIRSEHNFDEIVGSAPILLEALDQVERVSQTDATVLIIGETGTGKELFARAIHSRSGRKGRPLVKVNCGAIAAGLVESELFGHVKGAFTGALQSRIGRFELAHGGTIFLDEVGELPLDIQVKLLRALQEQEFEPVGTNRTVRVDVRVIAATNRNLEEAVMQGRFRPDLYYRLNVVPVRVPSLRERRSDIPHLVRFFVQRFAKKFAKNVEAVSREAMDRLERYPWNGNIRELQNVIERAVVLSSGPVLMLTENLLPTSFSWDRPGGPAGTATGLAAGLGPSPSVESLEEIERSHICRVLEKSEWVVEGPRGAAKSLDLNPNTLRSKMKKLGIRRPSREMSREATKSA
jgi:formate hydrogenlyase transcriptional activator